MTTPSKLESHWRLLQPNDYLAAADLRGKTFRVRIKAVARKELNREGTDEKKPSVVIEIEEAPKKFVANKTNLRHIAGFLGTPLTAEWIGKDIWLYPTSKEWKPKDKDWTGRGIRNPQTNQVEEAIRVWPVAPPNSRATRQASGRTGLPPPAADPTPVAEPEDDYPTGDGPPPEDF